MNPLLLSGLMSFGPALLSKLFGGNEAAELRKKIVQLTSAGNLNRLTTDFYRQAISSPAYSQALGGIATGANLTAGNVARHMGQSGIGASGTGAVLSSLTPSLVAGQTGRLRTGAYDFAGQQAQQAIQAQVNALLGTYGQPSQTQQLFGAGMNAFQPMLMAWLKSQYPGMFNFGNQQATPYPMYYGGGVSGYLPPGLRQE